MDHASENTSSTPPRAIPVASQLEGENIPISPNYTSQAPRVSPLPRWPDNPPCTSAIASSQAYLMAQSLIPMNVADAQADRQPFGDQIQHSVQSSQTRQNVQTLPGPRTPPGLYSKQLSNLTNASKAPSECRFLAHQNSSYPGIPDALYSWEADEREVLPSAPERLQEAKHYCPKGPTVKHARALTTRRSSSAESQAAGERLIEYLHDQTHEVALQQVQEKNESRQKESKAERIQMRIQKQRRTLKEYRAKKPSAQVKEGKKDQSLLMDDNTTLMAKAFRTRLPVREQPSPRPLPATPQEPAHEGSDAAVGELAPGMRPVKPRALVQAEPSGPEVRDNPEDEWTDIKLEDAEEPLGQEEWEDDIVSEMVPKGAPKTAWWLNMNP